MILAQHGYGKAQKIDHGISQGIIDGVIISPRDERQNQVPNLIANWLALQSDSDSLKIVFDSQLYASLISGARPRKLPEYAFYPGQLGRRDFMSIRTTQSIVHDTLGYQYDIPVTSILGPTVKIDALGGFWSGVSLTLSDEAVAHHASVGDSRSLFVSVLIDEAALLGSQEVLDAWLDDLTTLETSGFYLVLARRTASYPTILAPECMSKLLYLAYVLGEVNGYELHFGFSDLDGIPLIAVGASAIGTGWYSNLRLFNERRWLPSSGGRQARPRYTSAELMGSLLKDVELQTIYELGHIASVTNGDGFDRVFAGRNPADVVWSSETSCLQHWFALKRLVGDVSEGQDAGANLDQLAVAIEDSTSSFLGLEAQGVQFEYPSIGRRLRAWEEAVVLFRSEIGI